MAFNPGQVTGMSEQERAILARILAGQRQPGEMLAAPPMGYPQMAPGQAFDRIPAARAQFSDRDEMMRARAQELPTRFNDAEHVPMDLGNPAAGDPPPGFMESQDPARIRVAQALKGSKKSTKAKKPTGGPVAGGGDPEVMVDAEPSDEFDPYGGTALQSQGLNRMIERGTIPEALGEEIASGGGGIDVPAELAARIGMARSFMDEYPEIEAMVKAGDATGPIDQLTGRYLGMGKSGQVMRRIETGADALRRLLTGAALTGSETGDYADRYSPTFFNDKETALLKLQGLKRDLAYAMQAASLGRGITEILDAKGRPPYLLLDGSVDPASLKGMSDEELLKALEGQ